MTDLRYIVRGTKAILSSITLYVMVLPYNQVLPVVFLFLVSFHTHSFLCHVLPLTLPLPFCIPCSPLYTCSCSDNQAYIYACHSPSANSQIVINTYAKHALFLSL